MTTSGSSGSRRSAAGSVGRPTGGGRMLTIDWRVDVDAGGRIIRWPAPR